MNDEKTWVLNEVKTKEELLAGMRVISRALYDANITFVFAVDFDNDGAQTVAYNGTVTSVALQTQAINYAVRRNNK